MLHKSSTIRKHCWTRTIVAIIASIVARKLTLPVLASPMEAGQSSQQSVADNYWWINTLDSAINHPALPAADLDSNQVPRDSNQLHAWGGLGSDRSHGLLNQILPMWMNEEYVSAHRWHTEPAPPLMRAESAHLPPLPDSVTAVLQDPSRYFGNLRTDLTHYSGNEHTDYHSYQQLHTYDQNHLPGLNSNEFHHQLQPYILPTSQNPFTPVDHVMTSNEVLPPPYAEELPQNSLPVPGHPVSDQPSSRIFQALIGGHETAKERTPDTTPSPDRQDLVMKARPLSIPSSSFLKYHPQLTQLASDGQSAELPVVAAEVSSDAPALKLLINEHLFQNKLQWETKADNVMETGPERNLLNRFVQRINVRGSKYGIRLQTSTSNRLILVVPHPSYALGNFLFSPAPGPNKKLLFSLWAQSQDAEIPRMQFVGSAALISDDASLVIKQAVTLRGISKWSSATASSSQVSSVRPPRRNDGRAVRRLYPTSNDFLASYPLLEDVDDAIRRKPDLAAIHFISKVHKHSEAVRVAVDRVLWGSKVDWRLPPDSWSTPVGAKALGDIIRSHKRSKDLYVPKLEVSLALPYEIALIPYQIRDARARLFDPKLQGQAYAFTLWALDGENNKANERRYFLVSGGLVHMPDTKKLVKCALAKMEELKTAALHRA